MSEIAIKVENISKQYRLGEVGTGTLSNDLNRWWHKVRGKEDPYLKIGETNDRTTKGDSNYVWALKDINFEVKQGEVLGIIGKNGAGKSTLLKLLSRVTAPTAGEIKTRGRIASLLEVGTGFHPELTGRDNIFLNGAVLGMTKAETKAKFDEIVDFSGTARFIDTPVKRYSSGMRVRLAFAVAAHLEPEILIVDEVLAVGDAEFQNKAIGKMQDVARGGGRTVLFVSHNLNAIRNLCTSGILIENGKLVMKSTTSDVLERYLKNSDKTLAWKGIDGDENISVLETYIRKKGEIIKNEKFFTGECFEIGLHIKVHNELNDAVIGFNLFSSDTNPLLRSFYNDFNDLRRLLPGEYLVKFNIPPFLLASGNYKIEFDIALPFIKKINSSKINLEFELHSYDSRGNKYFLENKPLFNSIVRPNLFNRIERL